MRYAVVSDIHANLQAWKAVLLDIRSQKLDKIICLGDLVGYGPNPAEVLQSAYASVDFFVLGNHDAVIAGKMDAGLFNDRARRLIEWTRARLSADAVTFLGSLPLTLDGGNFRCTHGDFSNPAAFNYIIDPEDAVPSWQTVDTPLLFVGHTHWPALYVWEPGSSPRRYEQSELVLEPGKRYIVNVGSVGHPRDGEARASYCIFDTQHATVLWRRIPFDLDAYRQALDAAELSEETSSFLRHDPRLGCPPLREQLNFSPAKSTAQAARDVMLVRELSELTHKVVRWRTLALASLASILVIAAVGTYAGWRQARRGLLISDPALLTIHARAYPAREALTRSRSPIPDDSNLLKVPKAATSPGAPVPGWTIFLAHRHKQSVNVEDIPGQGPAFVLRSFSKAQPICLLSPLLIIEPNQRFRFYVRFREPQPVHGKYAVYIETVDQRGRTDAEWLRHVPTDTGDGWHVAQKVFPGKSGKRFPQGTAALRLQVRGSFTGTLYVDQVGLCRVE